MKTIKVTISGHVNTGKSSLAVVIQKALAQYGLQSVITEQHDEPMPDVEMAEHVAHTLADRGQVIPIDVVNLLRERA